jgi:hypothetical protein
MQNIFWEYYPLQESKITEIWENGIFVFDTNILFNLYRYSDDTSKDFIDTITAIQEKVWMPFQVAKEFHNRRLEVISNEIKSYDNLIKEVNEINDKIINKNRNPFLSKELMDSFETFKNNLTYESNKHKEKYELAFRKNDKILDKLNSIFDKKVGENFSTEKIKEIIKEGDDRYKLSVPPGYKDNSKPSPEKFGDLIIWFQIIEKAKTEQRPIVFVLDDRKEDWWFTHSGKTISPRVELLKEFKDKTGQICCFYQPFQFLEYAISFLGKEINDNTLIEIDDFKDNSIVIQNEAIELLVRILVDKSDVVRFVEVIKAIGYQCTSKEIEEYTYQVIVILPNIPDLERRFNQKYISLLENYNLALVGYKKI